MDEAIAIEHETSGRLFSVGQITQAILIGTPIAGGILVAQNYRTLGRRTEALQSLVFGIVATAVVFVIAFLLPEKFPNTVWPIAYTIGLREAVKHLQGDVIAEYEVLGKKSSWAIAVAVGIGCLILVMALALGFVFLLIPE